MLLVIWKYVVLGQNMTNVFRNVDKDIEYGL